MCQLIGLSSNKKVDIKLSLQEFKLRGKSNPHGWGFAYFNEDENKWEVVKKPSSLAEENVKSKEFGFKSKIIIGHVRLASCGSVSHRNTHPFEKEGWAFAHNGTVSKIKSQQQFSLKYFTPEGKTDSEYAFLYLLESLKNIDKNDLNEIFNLLKMDSEKIKLYGKFNFLLSDGDKLFAFGHDNLYFVLRKAPFQEVRLKYEEISINLNEIKDFDEKAVIVATEPLTENENWEKISGLKVFKDGEEINIENPSA